MIDFAKMTHYNVYEDFCGNSTWLEGEDIVSSEKYSEMLKLKGNKKDTQAQERFAEWYNSLEESEQKAFDKYEKKWTRISICIIAVIILALIGSCFGGGKNKTQSSKQETAQTQSVATKQEATQQPKLTGEDADKAQITEIAKKSTSHADFRDITITKVVDADKYNLVVFLNGKDNLTTNMIYTGYKFSCRDIFKGLYTSSMGSKINDVKISIYISMVNTQTGAKSDNVIYMLAMTRERANQMHWDNIESVDIEQAATERFIHPALRRELSKK